MKGGGCRKGLPPPHFFRNKNRRKKGIQDGRRTFIVDLAPLLKFASDNNEEYIFHYSYCFFVCSIKIIKILGYVFFFTFKDMSGLPNNSMQYIHV